MANEHIEIKPSHYLVDYESLYTILQSKDITLRQLQGSLNLTEDDIQKILRHEVVSSLKKIGEYLQIDFTKLYKINGRYDFTTDPDLMKWCDELRAAGYTLEYKELAYGEQTEFKMYRLGEMPITTISSSFAIALEDFYGRYIYHKENGYYPLCD